MKRLIINADDFGLTEGVNLAISDCFSAGVLTSATLMVNTPATDHAVKLVSDKKYENLGIGLHFNLTLGAPMCCSDNIPSLVSPNGEFYSRGEFTQRMILGLIKQSDVERELTAQYEKILSYGIIPTHIDGHQHIQAFSRVFEPLAKLCFDQKLAVRVPWVFKSTTRVSLKRYIKQLYLSYLLNRVTKKWRGKLSWNDYLASLFDLGLAAPVQLCYDHYYRLLDVTGEGVFELMVHPARNSQEQEGFTRIGEFSEAEWRVLRSERVQALIKQGDFKLCHFGNAWD